MQRLGWWRSILLFVLIASATAPALAAAPVTLSAEWCVSDDSRTLEPIASGGAMVPADCAWQALSAPSGLLSASGEALWVRLQLHNTATEPLPRWLTLGNGRIQRVELLQRDSSGALQQQQGGKALPRVAQSALWGEMNAFSLIVPAEGSVEYVLKVQSNSLVALNLKLWDPAVLRATRNEYDAIWILCLGMALSLLLLALAMGAHLRESSYAFFALAFAGAMLIEIHFSCVLQRTLWPEQWSMPLALVLLGVTSLVVGGTVLIRHAIASVRSAPWLRMTMLITAGLSLVGVLWSAVVDFPSGAQVWLLSGMFGLIIAMALCAQAWQYGSEAAGYLIGALALWLVGFGLRLMQIQGLWPETAGSDVTNMLISLVVGAWLLFGLAQRSVESRQALNTVKQDAAAQLAMFARISHELRTPLDTIMGNAQLLMRQRERPASLSVLKIMLDSGRHLLGMIDELLDYARGVTGALKIEAVPTHIANWLAGIERTGELLAARNQNRFEMRIEQDLVRGVYLFDASRLRQVLDNLLVNAARYTRHGRITLGGHLQAETRAPHRQFLHLYVEDTGSGIDPRDHERIFEPFERLERTSLAGGSGTGMGLPIARQLVSLMGGEITLLSSRGQGARFIVKVPIEPSSETTTAGEERSLAMAIGYRGPRRRLLVVDDDDYSRQLLVKLLSGVGFDTDEAVGGQAAERRLESGERFDVVLTDQFMPDGDGWWVLWACQKNQPGLPVILVSAALPHEPIGWDGRAQFTATLLRPIKHEDLLRKLGDLLDLEWIFDEPATGAMTTALLRPTAAQLGELGQLVAFGEVTAIREWAQALRTREPGFTPFADAVEQAVIELDFGRLELLAAHE